MLKLTDAEKQKLDLLRQGGREMAETWLHTAVTSAKGPDQMSNQVYILHCAAVSVLAHMIFNKIVQEGAKFEDCIAHMRVELEMEMAEMDVEECEVVYPKPNLAVVPTPEDFQ